MPLTMQEVLDKAVLGIIDQGGPAYIPGQGCRYRFMVKNQLRRCAIGQFIPEEDYRAEWEGQGIGEDWDEASEIRNAAGLDHLNADFLLNLQVAHDTAAERVSGDDGPEFWMEFRSHISALVQDWQLTMPNVRFPDTEQVD